MVTEKVKEVITKAVADDSFRQLLYSDPEQALKSFNLNADELASLEKILAGEFDGEALELGDRMSRAGIDLSLFTEVGVDLNHEEVEVYDKKTDTAMQEFLEQSTQDPDPGSDVDIDPSKLHDVFDDKPPIPPPQDAKD